MNPIFEALEEGHSPEEVIAYLSRMMPQMVPAIKKATRSGYSIQQILGFLSKNFDQEDRTGMSESERHAANRRADAERTKFGLKMAATAVAAPMAAYAARSALSRALPSSLTNILNPTPSPTSPQPPGAPQPPQQALPSIPGAVAGGQPPSVPPSPQPQGPSPISTVSSQPPIVQPSTIPQPPQTPQDQGISTNASQVLAGHGGAKMKIDELAKSGNGPEEISAYFEKFNKGTKKRLEKEAGQPFEKIVEDYIAQNPPAQAEAKEVIEPTAPEAAEAEPEPIKKADTVATPQGIGEVKEIRNGQAIVEVDGKLHKVKEEELEASPLPEKDLADLHDDLMRGIEAETGEEISRMVDFAGYDPVKNRLAFLPHTGALYTYENISPEDVALLTDILSVRKTSGENFIGAWKAGSKSPIGAAMSKLIQKLQAEAGGKGKEYSGKFETVYRATEPAKLASKKKKAEQVKADRERAKAEKEERKKKKKKP